MSIQHIALVLEAADLVAQEKSLLIALANHTDGNGKTFAGEQRLMREAGMPRTTFQRWRSRLVERELVVSRRRGRKGGTGGRATSDTYLNLDKLRSMRDPFFGATATDRPDDENPFTQVNRFGPTNEAEPCSSGDFGSASGADFGPVSGAGSAPPVEPVTLITPQSYTHTTSAPSLANGSNPASQGVCVSDDEIRITTDRVVGTVPSLSLRYVRATGRARIAACVRDCLAKGHIPDAIVAEADTATREGTQYPVKLICDTLIALQSVDPAAAVPQVTPEAPEGAETRVVCVSCSRKAEQLSSKRVCPECVAEGLDVYFAEVAS